MPPELPRWCLEMASVTSADESLLAGLDGVNVVMNRRRLARFLAIFGEDQDVRDLLTLDVLGVLGGLPLSSTGLKENVPSLGIRPFRLWEYTWLYKVLSLGNGSLNVLDLGGPASHLTLLAAIAGCRVASVDINPQFVHAARECAGQLKLATFDPRVGDMRDLSMYDDNSFDVVVSCSVLEHLTAADQMIALREAARVLKPGGVVGITFDFGLAAPGASIFLPPPHDPPATADEALWRYSQAGLKLIGNPFDENPVPGSLFHSETVQYTVASMFLAKPPLPGISPPECKNESSRLTTLRIPAFPYRLYKHLTGAAADADRTQNELAQATLEIRTRDEQIATLESAAAERLAAMHERGREVQIRDERIAILESAAAERLAVMQERGREVQIRDERITILESAAAERLAVMRERDREVQIRDERIAILESAAADRLTAMQERDHEIQMREERIAILESAAAERLVAMQERDREIQMRDERIAALQERDPGGQTSPPASE